MKPVIFSPFYCLQSRRICNKSLQESTARAARESPALRCATTTGRCTRKTAFGLTSCSRGSYGFQGGESPGEAFNIFNAGRRLGRAKSRRSSFSFTAQHAVRQKVARLSAGFRARGRPIGTEVAVNDSQARAVRTAPLTEGGID